MSTTMVTKESVTRKWYVLDAAGKPLGKTAALAADILRGKLKTDYTPSRQAPGQDRCTRRRHPARQTEDRLHPSR